MSVATEFGDEEKILRKMVALKSCKQTFFDQQLHGQSYAKDQTVFSSPHNYPYPKVGLLKNMCVIICRPSAHPGRAWSSLKLTISSSSSSSISFPLRITFTDFVLNRALCNCSFKSAFHSSLAMAVDANAVWQFLDAVKLKSFQKKFFCIMVIHSLLIKHFLVVKYPKPLTTINSTEWLIPVGCRGQSFKFERNKQESSHIRREMWCWVNEK